MRVSTSQMNMQAVNNMLDQQNKLSKIQNQLATGKRVSIPSDDPIAAGKALNISQSISMTEQYQRNSDVVTARLDLEESSMTSMTLVLNRVRELALQGNNGTVTDADRSMIASEMRGRLDDLLALSNTRDANGEYIYAGFQGRTQPFFRDTAGGFSYAGDDGQRLLQIGPARTVALGDSGTDVFQAIRNGNGYFSVADNAANVGSGVIDTGSSSTGSGWVRDTYTIQFTTDTTFEITDSVGTVVLSDNYVVGAEISFNGIKTSIKGTPVANDSFTISPSLNQDMFTTVQNVIDAFESPTDATAGSARLNNSVSRFLTDVDQALDNIHSVRAGIGARLNSIESQKDRNESQVINNKQTLSELIDIDIVQAITDLNLQRIGLESAQKSYMQIQGLSLFNYL
jgi:flagellar hook-associated protein 3 FlgL